MANMLKDGLEYLADMLEENASSAVTYTRGVSTVTFAATHARREYDIADDNGITRVVSVDFIIKASLLNFGSGAVEPQRNDSITATVAGVSTTFQVLDIAGQCFSKDTHGVMLRVHTKEVT